MDTDVERWKVIHMNTTKGKCEIVSKIMLTMQLTVDNSRNGDLIQKRNGF